MTFPISVVGVEQFAIDSPVFVSSHSPAFISPANLSIHSLCKELSIQTPRYTPTLVSHNQEIRIKDPRCSDTDTANPTLSLGVLVLHTPGHTPDELALWDVDDNMLYVGDTLYEWATIIFPNEGSVVDWFDSVDALIELVEGRNASISCGHTTAGRPATEVLQCAKEFMMDVLSSREKVRESFEKRGETFEVYIQEGMRFSLGCPKRLIEEAREKRDLWCV